ncbi:hypothetical protein NC652_041388 [Populus alba x Populus x berolinensis]|nr:hypothetical protein NC652_041388 [Populus alba x Populus x berolinensis]
MVLKKCGTCIFSKSKILSRSGLSRDKEPRCLPAVMTLMELLSGSSFLDQNQANKVF